jgi:hypothetical protein
MGDVINCTRFLCLADDLVPSPTEPVEIPQISLILLAYSFGSLLDVFGEKTTEQDVMNALQETNHQWREQEIPVDVCDFASYPKLDVFPATYVIFLELIGHEEHKIDAQQLRFLQNTVSSEVEQQLCKANQYYKGYRSASKLDPVDCILVRSGTFSTFMRKILLADRVSPTQVKPHRLLRNKHDIQFFYDNQIDILSS